MRHDFPFARAEGLLARLFRPMFKRRLASLGSGAIVSPYATLEGMADIAIGADSYVSRRSLLMIVPHAGDGIGPSSIAIGTNTYVGRACTLSACGPIRIGDNVTFGDNVYLSAGQHGFDRPEVRVLEQPMRPGAVEVKDGAWIGYGAFISTTDKLVIGEGAIVAANAVVTRSVPDYTMVAGVPARAIKRYDRAARVWIAL